MYGLVVMLTIPRSSPMSLINKIVMVALCRIRTPEAYKEANEFFADEFLFQKKWTQVEQKNFGFLDLKFNRNKKGQETDSSGKKHFLPEYLVLSDYFKTSQIQNLVFFRPKKIAKHAYPHSLYRFLDSKKTSHF